MAGIGSSCLLCAPLVEKTVESMIDGMCIAKEEGADVLELRVDHLARFDPPTDLQRLLKARTLPSIVTYRPKWEGGQYEGDEKARLDVLQLAFELGADYIDVELQVASDVIANLKKNRSSSCQIIVSNHNYKMTPSAEELGALVAKIQSTGADIVKFATTAQNITDVASVFQILTRSQIPTIALVMGPKGLLSRILCGKYGGYLTFGSLASGQESAPGQPTLKQLTQVYRFHSINCDTKVFGIIGNPVGHSKSPLLHNSGFSEIGVNAVYVPFLVDDVSKFLEAFSFSDFTGFSVTIPHKEAALKCCDELDPAAEAIGAVNTIVRRQSDGKLIGYNTDCEGAITAIENGLEGSHHSDGSSALKGKHFVVIGAGGAGKALAYGAKQRGAKVVIANRNFERAKVLADNLGMKAIPLDDLSNFCPEAGMILANTTSVGMQPNIHETPISKEALKSYCLVFDAVYTPRVTRLLKEAEEAGARVVSGIEMFVRQAIAQFELFTEKPAPVQLMREVIYKNV